MSSPAPASANQPESPTKTDCSNSDQFDEAKTPAVIAWKLARSAIEHENSLTNHRVTWLFASQGFLLSAFALLFLAWTKGEGKKEVLGIVPLLLMIIGLFALYICITLQVSLLCGYRALQRLTEHHRNFSKDSKFHAVVPPLHYWEHPGLKGLFREHFLPGAFGLLWFALLVALRLSQAGGLALRLQSFTASDALDWLVKIFAVIGGGAAIYWLKNWRGLLGQSTPPQNLGEGARQEQQPS